ncbi:MAG: hypothetical protein ACREO9_04610 [Lysobacterales bacterium]
MNPKRILRLGALGELLVGVLATLFPGPVMSFLLADPAIANSLAVARIAGIAIIALGLTWWRSAQASDTLRLSGLGAGFLTYNAGIGMVFLVRAWPGESWLWVPLAIAVVHLLVAFAFAIAAMKSRLSGGTGVAV